MPLLDHFHPPLAGHRHWKSFHGRWAAAMADGLNEVLPPDCFAEFQVTLGPQIEVDVATFDDAGGRERDSVMPAVFPDDIEVLVFNTLAGPSLVGAIELVSPRNKDRDDARRAFTTKCASYLQRGIGLIIVDIVTSRRANLHDELVALLGQAAPLSFPEPALLYAAAYRPAHREDRNEIDIWRETLTLGKTLPTLPLAIRGLGCVAVELEKTYTDARNHSRLD